MTPCGYRRTRSFPEEVQRKKKTMTQKERKSTWHVGERPTANYTVEDNWSNSFTCFHVRAALAISLPATEKESYLAWFNANKMRHKAGRIKEASHTHTDRQRWPPSTAGQLKTLHRKWRLAVTPKHTQSVVPLKGHTDGRCYKNTIHWSGAYYQRS